MKNIIKYIMLITISISTQFINGQDVDNNNLASIKSLQNSKEIIKNEERDFLKTEVEFILKRLEKGEITQEQADEFKLSAAKKRALNIENRTVIVDNRIALLERNEKGYDGSTTGDNINYVRIGSGENTSEDFIFIGNKKDDNPKKFDRRTRSDLVIAFGLNNAIVEGEKLDDSPYEFGGSRFFEIGWAWKTRVFNKSNFLRFKYGFSFQMNGLKPTDNGYFVENGNQTYVEDFPNDLRKSKLTITNLVVPIHFEFGPSKKIEKDHNFRYSTSKQFKIGIGGYAGFNIGTRQKLKYTIDGDRVKDKLKRDYNTSNLVYGLSSYVAFNATALYVKYDLSPIFKNQTIEQNNISLGIRFDFE